MSKLLHISSWQELDIDDKEDEVIVIIPTSAVLIKAVKLPKASLNKLRQAIPYALEEDLIDDVETLHFALGQWHEGSLTTIVIAKSKLKNWLDELSNRKIQPTQFLPSVFTLPWKSNAWTLLMFEDHALLRTGMQNGLSIAMANITFTLQTLIDEIKETLPETLIIYNYSKNVVPVLPIKTEVINDPPDFLQLAAKTIKSIKPINLLQGDYRIKHKVSALRRNWRLVGIIATAWILVIFLGDISNYFYYRWKNNELKQQISILLNEVFPQTKNIADPQIAVKRLLKRLQISASGGPFLGMLAKAGKVLQNNKNIKIKNLNFSENSLQFKITTNSFNQLDQFNKQLRQSGLSATQSNVNSKGKIINAEITIKQ